MSRTVHLLKFYQENPDVIEKDESFCRDMLHYGKKNDEVLRDLIRNYNNAKGITVGPEFFKGLSLPRIKILIALVAQKEGFNIIPSICSHLEYESNTPLRFIEKFRNLLAFGFWLLGTVIEDSLSEDPCVNCDNPFGFIPGDLGLWWAGVVIMDWYKYTIIEKDNYKYVKCTDFYNDSIISRKFKYSQNSALSSMNRIPQQFLTSEDMENFMATIENTTSYQITQYISCQNLNPFTMVGRTEEAEKILQAVREEILRCSINDFKK